MEIIQAIWDWASKNLVTIVAIGWTVEKALRLLDNLLPKSITVDNDIADYIAKILNVFAPKKTDDE